MNEHTLPPRAGGNFADQPHVYDPVTQPQLFQGVIGKRFIAFIIDAAIIFFLTVLAYAAVAVLGIVTLGLAWLLFGLVFPAVGLGYNA
ncbi:MAG TPA: RDD family protein, partial [Methyloceanibacter sp.]|nr:RDD family protein [Methyloceanibacter sp.]